MDQDNILLSSRSCSSSSCPEPLHYNGTAFLELTRNDIVFTHCFSALIVDRIITPLWYIIGIAGNIISASVWLHPRMQKNSSSAVYLAALSINDTLFLLLHPVQELKYAWFLQSVDYPGLCEVYAMFFLYTQYLAPVLVLGFSIDRFIAVCHPFKKKRLCTVIGSVRVVIASLLSCLLLGAVQSYLWTFDGSECRVRKEAQLGGQRSLWFIWSWISELVVFLLVPLTILFFNILVIREIRRLSRSEPQAKERHLSSRVVATNAMLLLVSFYVIFTTLPATLVYALALVFPEGDRVISHEQIKNDPVWSRHVVYVSVKKVVDELCLSHYACNFFLFAATGKRFRKLVRKMVQFQKTEPNTECYSRPSRKTPEQNTFIAKV